jgi:diguanylate cyclase (GGDEF)-like protein
MNEEADSAAVPEDAGQSSRPLDLARQAFRRTDFSEALRFALRALEEFRAQGDLASEALALAWAGAALAQQSRYQEALDHLNQSLEMLISLGREDLSALPLNYTAIVYEELGDLDTALSIYEKGYALAAAAGNRDLAGRILGNIGEAYVNIGDHERAMTYLEKACALLEETGSFGNLGWCLQTIARIKVERGENEGALHYFEVAFESAERDCALCILAETRAGLGSFYAKLGDYDRAREQLYLALDCAEKASVKREVFKVHLALAEAHEKFGDYERALHHFKAFHDIRSAVFDEVTKARISSLTAATDLERERLEREMSHLRNVELAEALAKLRDQAEELERLSVRDHLTGVFNRRYLAQSLAAEVKRCRRYGTSLSIAIADVDHFKHINDNFSHSVGDHTLKTLVSIMEAHLRHVDLLARYGGEEFVLLLPETELDSAILACDRIRLAIEQYEWEKMHPSLRVTASFGVAVYQAGITADWEKLLAAADEKLFEAKQGGRNRVCG